MFAFVYEMYSASFGADGLSPQQECAAVRKLHELWIDFINYYFCAVFVFYPKCSWDCADELSALGNVQENKLRHTALIMKCTTVTRVILLQIDSVYKTDVTTLSYPMLSWGLGLVDGRPSLFSSGVFLVSSWSACTTGLSTVPLTWIQSAYKVGDTITFQSILVAFIWCLLYILVNDNRKANLDAHGTSA